MLKSATLDLALARILGKKVYIDSCVFIYFLDQNITPMPGQSSNSANFFDAASLILQACAKQRCFGATGDAAVAEVLVNPYRKSDALQIARFKQFFNQKNFLNVLPHDYATFDTAAQIVAQHRLKLIDALHIATAVQSSCAFFITNDLSIQAAMPKNLSLEVICLNDLLTSA